jgi:hypothetical protein
MNEFNIAACVAGFGGRLCVVAFENCRKTEENQQLGTTSHPWSVLMSMFL